MKEVTWIEVSIISSLLFFLLAIVGWFVKTLHRQAMGKFDQLIENVNKLTTAQAIHDERLEVGKEEFKRIETHQSNQDARIHKLEKWQVKVETVLEKTHSR